MAGLAAISTAALMLNCTAILGVTDVPDLTDASVTTDATLDGSPDQDGTFADQSSGDDSSSLDAGSCAVRLQECACSGNPCGQFMDASEGGETVCSDLCTSGVLTPSCASCLQRSGCSGQLSCIDSGFNDGG